MKRLLFLSFLCVNISLAAQSLIVWPLCCGIVSGLTGVDVYVPQELFEAKKRLPILAPQGQIDNKLFAAVKNNNMTEIDRLIEGGARVNTKQADSWMTPLMCAIEFGTTTTCTKENKTASVENKDVVSCMEEMVKRLLSAQANVNDYNLNGETALIVATRKGSKQIPIHIFELLLQNDANKYWRDTLPQKSALDYAKQNKDRALINLLEKTDKDS